MTDEKTNLINPKLHFNVAASCLSSYASQKSCKRPAIKLSADMANPPFMLLEYKLNVN
jgi:hypothetical protein